MLGGGGEAKVYKCLIEKEDEKQISYATKVRETTKANKDRRKYIKKASYREYSISKDLNHKNLL